MERGCGGVTHERLRGRASHRPVGVSIAERHSFVVGIVSTLRHKAVFGVTVDAAIFGFTTGFGLLPIITVLTAGHLPNPVPQAISAM